MFKIAYDLLDVFAQVDVNRWHYTLYIPSLLGREDRMNINKNSHAVAPGMGS